MNEFRKALARYSRFENYFEAARGHRDRLFREILLALGIERVYIEKITFWKGICRIDYGWSCRGLTSGDDVEFPECLLDAADPIEAVRQWKVATEARNNAESLALEIAAARELLGRHGEK